jgi:hypothetical protein
VTNRIVELHVRPRRWDPAEAELWITVVPEHRTPTTEIRGRLVGPRCPGVTTVEVALPLRPVPRADGPLTVRVIIPEPVACEPGRPYRYEGFVELWQDGQPVDRRPVHVQGRPGVD